MMIAAAAMAARAGATGGGCATSAIRVRGETKYPRGGQALPDLPTISKGNSMDQRVIDFITALRAAGVRVSVAESADAMRAIEAAGIATKDWFRSALRATLVKEP